MMLKRLLEKTPLVWFIIACGYVLLFNFSFKELPATSHEEARIQILREYSSEGWIPKKSLVVELQDWGHVAHYSIFGQFGKFVQFDLTKLRWFNLSFALLSLLFFTFLGMQFIERNRMNPMWVSLALMILAANPFYFRSAIQFSSQSTFFTFLFLAFYFYQKEFLGWSALFQCLAILVDRRGFVLSFAILFSRLFHREHGKILRPERMLAVCLPLVVGLLPLLAWKGLVPQGKISEQLAKLVENKAVYRLDQLFYVLAILPLYVPWYLWAWGFKARFRSVTACAVVAVLAIPVYFIFPIQSDQFAFWIDGVENMPLGLIDQGLSLISAQYKNLMLFPFFLVGVFLFFQIFFMELLEQSRVLFYTLIFSFLTLGVAGAGGDEGLIFLIPYALLLSLSEVFVGEEGKLI